MNPRDTPIAPAAGFHANLSPDQRRELMRAGRGCDANYSELNDGLYFRSERDAFGNTRPLVAPAKKPMRIRVTGGPLTKPFDVIAFHTLEAIKFCVQAHGVGAYKAAVQK